MRQAIVTLRQRRLSRKDTPPPDLREEAQLRDLALLQFHASEQWEPAVGAWLDVVLVRYARKLHDVQWRLIQFLALVSLHRDRLGSVSTLLLSLQDRVRGLSDLFGLRTQFVEMLRDLKPLLFQAPAGYTRSVQRAIHVLHQRSAEALTLDQVAGIAGVSPEHLARRLKQETGFSFTDYLQRLRVQEAAGRLAISRDGLLGIAADCGFGSVEQFHRVFKRWLGRTPHQYRLGLRREVEPVLSAATIGSRSSP